MGRFSLAVRSFFSILGDGKLSDEIASELGLVAKANRPVAPKPDAPTVRVSDGALQVLGIFQRDARLVDFIMEDLSSYSDEQVGGAIRSMHEECHKTLNQYFKLSPVVDGVEGAYTKAESSPGVKLMGNIPPNGKADGGILRHRGWKVDSIQLPNIPARTDLTIIAPAELEVE